MKQQTITADTADELNEKRDQAKAERLRQEAISDLADLVRRLDKAKIDAKRAVERVRNARRAIKKVRRDPKATFEEIRAAMSEAGKCGY